MPVSSRTMGFRECFLLLVTTLIFCFRISGAVSKTEPVRVVVVESVPYVIRDPESGAAKGFMIDILKEMKNRYNLNYTVRFANDGKYGVKTEYGSGATTAWSWNGIVGELARQEADVSFTPLTMTHSRKQVIAFSQPIFTNGIVMLIKKPKPGEKIRWTRMTDLLDQNEVDYGAVDGGSTMEFFRNSVYDAYAELGRKMAGRLVKMPKNYSEAIRMAKGGKFIFLGERDIIEYHTDKECDLMILGNQVNTISHALGFPQDSLLTKTLDKYIAEIMQDGTWKTLKTRWWVQKCGKPQLCMCEEQPGSWNHEKKKYEVSHGFENSDDTPGGSNLITCAAWLVAASWIATFTV